MGNLWILEISASMQSLTTVNKMSLPTGAVLGRSARATTVRHSEDSLVEVVFETAAVHSLLASMNGSRMWLSSLLDSGTSFDVVNVVETPIEAFDGREDDSSYISCLVAAAGDATDAKCFKGDPLVILRIETDDDARSVDEYHSVCQLSERAPGQSVRPIGMCGNMASVTSFNGQISSTAKYKLHNRTDERAKLYPELEEEIAQRRAQARGPVEDRYS